MQDVDVSKARELLEKALKELEVGLTCTNLSKEYIERARGCMIEADRRLKNENYATVNSDIDYSGISSKCRR